MSRAPMAAKAPAPAPVWHPVSEGGFPKGTPLLVTADPEKDPNGRNAIWMRRRAHQSTRWVNIEGWADLLSHQLLNPQPTHWRSDPRRADWRQDMEPAI